MRLALLLTGLLLACWPTAPLPAQEEMTAEQLEELRRLREGLYPDFISPATPIPEAATAEEEPGEEAPQVLAADLASTTTWFGTRELLPGTYESYRVALLAGGVEEVAKTAGLLEEQLALLARMAPIQAPRQREAIRRVTERLTVMVGLIERDFRRERFRELRSTDELVLRELADLERLLRASDADRRLDGEAVDDAQMEWDAGSFGNARIEQLATAWSATRLVEGIDSRRRAIERGLRAGADAQDLELAREIGGLARELASRVEVVSPVSRIAFRNAALRLDVIAQNLHDFAAEGNTLHARRQSRQLAKALDDVAAYLTAAE